MPEIPERDGPPAAPRSPYEAVIDPDCRDGKCGSCVGGPCEHECHQPPGEAPAAPACGRAEPHVPHTFGEHQEDHCRGTCFCEQPASDAPAADPEAPKPCLREYVHDAHEYYDPDDGGAWRWCPGRTPADAVTDHAQAERRVRRLRTALIDIAGLEDGESQNLTDHELIDKAWDAHEPATPPGPSADEIRDAIAEQIRETEIPNPYPTGARVSDLMADALMDRVVGPLIAERDDQNERLMIKSRYAEYYRAEADEQRQRADERTKDLEAVNAELWRAVQDHNAERQRAERAENNEQATRNAFNAQADLLERTTDERDRLRKAVDQVRAKLIALKDEWWAAINSGVMHGSEWEQCLEANLPSLYDAIAALDGTDGERGFLADGPSAQALRALGNASRGTDGGETGE